MIYQFDVVDIIIVQSAARRMFVRRRAHMHRCEISAKKIQTVFRSYLCMINFLHSIADVLLVQSVARRWIALKKFKIIADKNAYLQYNSAITIQTIWRGFQCYTDYIFTMADIVIVQRTVRHWLAVSVTERLRIGKVDRAAAKIQSVWRGYKGHLSMLVTLVNIIIVQVSSLTT